MSEFFVSTFSDEAIEDTNALGKNNFCDYECDGTGCNYCECDCYSNGCHWICDACYYT